MGQSTSSDQRQSILNDLRITPVCLFVSVFVCLCIYLSVCLLACLPACLSVCLQRTSTKTTKNTLIHNSRAYVIDKKIQLTCILKNRPAHDMCAAVSCMRAGHSCATERRLRRDPLAARVVELRRVWPPVVEARHVTRQSQAPAHQTTARYATPVKVSPR